MSKGILAAVFLVAALAACDGDYYGVPFYCDDYYELARARGYADGHEDGLSEGRQEGRDEGREDGREEGLERGRQEGQNQTCSSIMNLSNDLYFQLRSRGIC